MNALYKIYLRACVGAGNLYGLVLGYWICARGAEAAPIESTVMFVLILWSRPCRFDKLERSCANLVTHQRPKALPG